MQTHYAENILSGLFLAVMFLAMFASHGHNDSLCAWAQTAGGNILSALFGIMVGARNTTQ